LLLKELLKWKINSNAPIVVQLTIKNSGFKVFKTKSNSSVNGYQSIKTNQSIQKMVYAIEDPKKSPRSSDFI